MTDHGDQRRLALDPRPDRERFRVDFLTDYSDDGLIAELRRVAALVPSTDPLTKTAFETISAKVSASTLQRRFGGWRQALEAAGLDSRYVGTPVSKKMKLQASRHLSNNALLQEIRRIRQLVGTEWLTRADFNTHSAVSAETIRARFGSFTKGLKMAGIPVSPTGSQQPSVRECFENLGEVWTHYGRVPRFREMFSPPSRIRGKSYETRWGTWRKAVAAFVNWANQENDSDQNELNEAITEQKISTSGGIAIRVPEDRREVPPALRFKVFKRDQFRCVSCGRSPAIHLGIELHADHIVAFANGGKTTFGNLQTLCQTCNLGKGSRL